MIAYRRGDVNEIHGVIGDPQCGKTQHAVRCAMKWIERGAYCIAVDAAGDIPAQLHGGVAVPIERHETIESVRRALGDPDRLDKIHSVRTMDPVPALQLAREIVDKKTFERDGDKWAPIVIVYIDEVSLWEQATAIKLTRKSTPELLELIGMRRHWHVIVLYTTQSPRMINTLFLDKTNHLTLFKVAQKHDLAKLTDGGVRDEDTLTLPHLEPYEGMEIRR